MAVEPSRALVRRSTDIQLMQPPPKRIKRPQKVLDEDVYTEAVSQIIARDFFPGLLETETQQEYLDALDSKDNAWISSAGQRLNHIMTPGKLRGRRGTSMQTYETGSATPRDYRGDTPLSLMSRTSVTSGPPSRPSVDTNMSLSAFQSKYTSEDNESFYKLLDKQNQKKADKYAWLWRGNMLPSKRLIKQKEIETKLLESGQALTDDGGRRDRLAISDVGEKPAMPETWKVKPNNNLMFNADSVEDSVETLAQKAQDLSRAAPKGVNYGNTRLQALEATQSSIPPSPSLSAIKDAIAGRPRRTDSESGYDGSETPRVNGYAFVDDEAEEEFVNHRVTIDLGIGDATPNPFKIKAQSSREDLHHRMVDRVAQRNRAASMHGMASKSSLTPVPKFPSSPRVGSGGLTPAAQRLWSRVGRSSYGTPSSTTNKTPKVIKGNGSGLKVDWTPK